MTGEDSNRRIITMKRMKVRKGKMEKIIKIMENRNIRERKMMKVKIWKQKKGEII
jgi:hypothetical protein